MRCDAMRCDVIAHRTNECVQFDHLGERAKRARNRARESVLGHVDDAQLRQLSQLLGQRGIEDVAAEVEHLLRPWRRIADWLLGWRWR